MGGIEVTCESTWKNPFPTASGTNKFLNSRARASLLLALLVLLGIRDGGGHCDRGHIGQKRWNTWSQHSILNSQSRSPLQSLSRSVCLRECVHACVCTRVGHCIRTCRIRDRGKVALQILDSGNSTLQIPTLANRHTKARNTSPSTKGLH